MNNERTPLTLTAKICMFLAGLTNFILGYAIYFVLYDTDREKAAWFRYGARVTVILIVIYSVLAIIGAITGAFSLLT